MAWSYSDYVTMAGAERLERLRSHIKEVSDECGVEMQSGDFRINPYPANDYLKSLLKELRQLETVANLKTMGGGRSRIRFG